MDMESTSTGPVAKKKKILLVAEGPLCAKGPWGRAQVACMIDLGLEFTKGFNHPLQRSEAVKRLLGLCQGRQLASQHALKFRTIAARTSWEETELFGTFLNLYQMRSRISWLYETNPRNITNKFRSLSVSDECFWEQRRAKNYTSQPPSILEEIGFSSNIANSATSKARYDNYVTKKFPSTEIQRNDKTYTSVNKTELEPMQVDRTRLTTEER